MENDVNINDNIEDNDENMSDADYQIQRRIRHNQLQRCLRKSQIGLSRLRFFLKICFVILLIYVGYRALKLPMWYIKKDIFNTAHNQYLTIQNNKIVPDYKILSALRNARIPDKPIYMITPKIFEDNIKKLEPIKNVHVRRFWYPASRFQNRIRMENALFRRDRFLSLNFFEALLKKNVKECIVF